jgi:hypothetical protein
MYDRWSEGQDIQYHGRLTREDVLVLGFASVEPGIEPGFAELVLRWRRRVLRPELWEEETPRRN